MNRRDFLGAATVLAAASALPAPSVAAGLPPATVRHLPRWRGFNLLEKFTKRTEGNPAFAEADFEMLAEWGFDFVRLPLSYLCWSEAGDWRKLEERELRHLDEAVEFGRRHNIHVNLNLHRAPGYCVNPPKEPLDLWKDAEALEACRFQWAHLARRFKGVPAERVSFDLLNEPADIPEATYVRVVKALVEAIHGEDPGRLVIADGLKWGTAPVRGLAGLGVAQSTRGYEPMQISHHKASWINGSDRWPEPTWPLHPGRPDEVNRETLRKSRIEPWKALEAMGVGVHVGEWGAFNRTPHAVTLAWMKDCLGLWREAGWGWSLWNFRGSFGVLDSDRQDVRYETHRGHKLDREMLEVLREG